MVRLLLVLALGLQPIVGQVCGIQASCNNCVVTSGCVWKSNACWSASTFPFCDTDASCFGYLSTSCPAPIIYPTLYGGATTSLPLYSNPAPVSPYASAPIYASASAPIYTSASAPIYASASAPIYSSYPVYNSYPVYSSYPVYNAPSSYYPYSNVWSDPYRPQLFDFDGRRIVDSTVRNNFYANSLNTIIPGIGGAVQTANNLNLLGHSDQYFDNLLSRDGYHRDPFGTWVRNNYYGNAIGTFLPGTSSSLAALNQWNLYYSLLN